MAYHGFNKQNSYYQGRRGLWRRGRNRGCPRRNMSEKPEHEIKEYINSLLCTSDGPFQTQDLCNNLQTSSRSVNRILYSLQRNGIIKKVIEQPPTWVKNVISTCEGEDFVQRSEASASSNTYVSNQPNRWSFPETSWESTPVACSEHDLTFGSSSYEKGDSGFYDGQSMNVTIKKDDEKYRFVSTGHEEGNGDSASTHTKEENTGLFDDHVEADISSSCSESHRSKDNDLQEDGPEEMDIYTTSATPQLVTPQFSQSTQETHQHNDTSNTALHLVPNEETRRETKLQGCQEREHTIQSQGKDSSSLSLTPMSVEEVNKDVHIQSMETNEESVEEIWDEEKKDNTFFGKYTDKDKILIALNKAKNSSLQAIDIARALGHKSKKLVNPALYSMERQGLIHKINNVPPVWRITTAGRLSIQSETIYSGEPLHAANEYPTMQPLHYSMPESRDLQSDKYFTGDSKSMEFSVQSNEQQIKPVFKPPLPPAELLKSSSTFRNPQSDLFQIRKSPEKQSFPTGRGRGILSLVRSQKNSADEPNVGNRSSFFSMQKEAVVVTSSQDDLGEEQCQSRSRIPVTSLWKPDEESLEPQSKPWKPNVGSSSLIRPPNHRQGDAKKRTSTFSSCYPGP